jgi:hypothetical protein
VTGVGQQRQTSREEAGDHFDDHKHPGEQQDASQILLLHRSAF